MEDPILENKEEVILGVSLSSLWWALQISAMEFTPLQLLKDENCLFLENFQELTLLEYLKNVKICGFLHLKEQI